MYLCMRALVCVKKGRHISKRAQMCLWTEAHVTASVRSYILRPLCIRAAAIPSVLVFPHFSRAICDFPAAFNTCSSHRENTPLSLQGDKGVESTTL